MALILVVEQEGRYIERIRDALSAEGWRTEVADGHPEALRAASSEAPSLVLVNSELAGADGVVAAFARRHGGPGVVALVGESRTDAVSADELGVDAVLVKPFTEQQLRLVVRRSLAGGRPAAPAAAPVVPESEAKLTSAEIFGDLVAEIEGELEPAEPVAAEAESTAAGADAPAEPAASAAPPAEPAPSEEPPSAAPPAEPPPFEEPPSEAPPLSPAAVSAPSASAPSAAPPHRSLDDAEIERRLEETLSGVLGSGRRPPPPPRRRRLLGDADVEALLDETLSGLHLGPRHAPRAAAAGPPAAAPAARAAPPLPPAAPSGFEDLLAQLDLDALGGRRPHPSPPAAGPSPASPEAASAGGGAAEPAAPEEAAAAAEPPAVEVLPALDELPELPDFSAPPELPELPEPVPLESPLPVEEPAPAAEAAPSPASGEVERFGQYSLLERIAVGGMAEVWKARMRGVEGFQKTVAIKRILPELTDGEDFVTMFIDEAKLAAQLNHPNIIHIYDLGKLGEHYYIAMEYVEGQNLRSILNAARDKDLPLPVDLALLIGARLASALDHAHRKRDFEHRELGLVHRDVSPQNVLISYEGDIKLCDFGIAKAVANASRTQMGALKGKLQYMSPEQAWGRTVDARSDLFSLGSLLFEMLTGRRLFVGDSEISVLEAVRECRVEAPRSINPEIPAEVEAIVLKALAKDPDARHASAGELQLVLEQALYARLPTPTPADLAAYLKRLREAPTAARAAKPVPAPAGDRGAPAPSPGEPDKPEPAPPADGEPPAPAAPALASLEALAPHDEVGAVEVEEGGRKGRGLLIVVILLVIAAGVAAAIYFGLPGRLTPPPAPGPVVESAAPEPAAVEPAAGEPLAAGAGAEEAASAAAAPATAEAAPATAVPPELEKLVEQELARREQQIRGKLEAEQKRLEEELARAKQQQPPPPQ